MSTDQLLDALKVYAVSLTYNTVAGVWQVCLYDWAFLHVEDPDPHAALTTAWEQVQREVEQI